MIPTAASGVCRSEKPLRGFVRTIVVEGEIVELTARNTHPEERFRASSGWVARVMNDPAGAKMPADNESDAIKAAQARISELRTAEAVEREVRR